MVFCRLTFIKNHEISRLFSMAFWMCIVLIGSSAYGQTRKEKGLAGKIICVDAGHGGTALTDSFRAGPGGEREEWINLRVAKLLETLLVKKGAKVIMTRTADVFVPIATRAKMAMDNNADLFLSIHHNATADRNVNFPIIYFHGNASENQAGVALGKKIAYTLTKGFYTGNSPVSLVSDHTIFSTAGAGVLRLSYGIPGVLAEASFFSNAEEEGKLKRESYNLKEAKSYLKALEAYFKTPALPIRPKDTINKLPPFKVLQEAERMDKAALSWYEDFREGERLMKQSDEVSIQKAFDLFTRSARSFPDSYVAGKCHQYRSVLLQKMGKLDLAAQEARRAEEFYIKLED